MSSSTSNSSSNSKARSGPRVLALLAVILLLLELFTRFKLFDMSKDFRRFKTYPGRAQVLSQANGYRVALIGNSATDRGVDASVFASTMSSVRGTPVIADKFVADQSRANTWRYLLNRYFWRPGNSVDLFVINYYELNLDDGQEIEIGRLAQFFTTPRDWPEVLREDLPQIHQQVEFLLSTVWATYASRERMKERVLKLAIPGYEQHVQQLNGVMYHHNLKAAAGLRKPRSYGVLRRLLAAARAHGARLCFVAYPTLLPGKPDPYDIDPEARRLIEEAGMSLLDLRRVPGITPADYADEVHLTEEAMPAYSRYLAKAVLAVIR